MSRNQTITERILLAVIEGKLEIVRILINSSGLPYSEAWLEEHILLYNALKKNKENVVELLSVSSSKVASISELLHVAIAGGHLNIVESLLKYGGDVNLLHNLKSTLGFTPLHTAVENQREEVAKLLISYGADINARDNIGKTPIFYATENANVNITNLLLTNRAYVKEYPELLCNAVKNDYIDIVKALLHYDTDINAIDEFGRTALHFTVLTETDDVFRHLSIQDHNINVKAEIANLLLSKGANVDAVTEDGITALHVAILKGYTEIVEILLEYNANVNYRIRNGISPLHLAAKKGFRETIEILLKFGADISSIDDYGRTALYIAAEKNHEYVFTTLLNHGSHLNIISSHDKTLLAPLLRINNDFNDELFADTDDDDDDSDSDNYNFDGDYNIEDEYDGDAYNIDDDFVGYDYILDDYFDGDDFNYYNFIDKSDDDDLNFYSYLSDEIAGALKRHLIKMKVANLYVDQTIFKLMKIKFRSGFGFQCRNEIEKMKCEMINVKISFYDFLVKNAISLLAYVKNNNIVKALQSESYKTTFPIYAEMIESNFTKATLRKELQNKGNEVFHCLFNNTPELPYDCTEQIVNYLNVEDIKSLMRVCSSS